MGSAIKGITVALSGDTTDLNKSIEDIEKSSKATQTELSAVNKALKFDPSNTVLLTQKQELLAEQISNTKNHLAQLESVQGDVEKAFENGDLGADKYRAFQREVEYCKTRMKSLEEQSQDTQKKIDGTGDEAEDTGKDLKTMGNIASDSESKMKNLEEQSQDTQKKIEGTGDEAEDTGKDLKTMGKNASDSESKFDSLKKSAKSLASNGLDVAKASAKGLVTIFTAAAGTISAAGAAIINYGSEFEESMAKVQTLADTNEVSLQDLSSGILDLSTNTGIASTTLSEAMYSALSAGVDTADTLDYLNLASKLAVGGFTDVDTAVDGLSSAVNAYGSELLSAEDAAKVMIQTQNLGKTTVGDLASNISKVTPTATALGVSFQEVGAALSVMTAKGVKTETACTQLKTLYSELSDTSSDLYENVKLAAEATTGQSLSFSELQDKGYNVAQIMQMVRDYAESNGQSLYEMMSSTEAVNAALTITGDSLSTYSTDLNAMSTSTDVVTEAFETMQDTFSAQKNKFVEGSKNLASAAYEYIQEPLKDIMKDGNGMIETLSTALSEGGIDGLVGAFGDVLADIVDEIGVYAPKIIDMGTKLITSLCDGLTKNGDSIANSAMLIITSIADGLLSSTDSIINVVGSLLLTIIDSIKNNLPTFSSTIMEGIQKIIESLCTMIPNITSSLLDLLPPLLTNIINGLITAIPQIINAIVQMFQAIAAAIPTIVPIIVEALPSIINSILTGLLSALPQINSAGVQLLTGLIGALPQIIQTIVNALPEIIKNIISGILGAIPQVIDAGIQLFLALINALPDIIVSIVDALPAIIDGIISGLLDALPKLVEAGIKLFVAIIQNTPKIITGIVKHIPEIIAGIIEGFSNLYGKMAGVGGNILAGLWQGICDGAAWLWDCISGFCEELWGNITGFFGIHSPSRLFRDELGKNLMLGWSIGIDDNSDDVKKSIADVSESVNDISENSVLQFKNNLSNLDGFNANVNMISNGNSMQPATTAVSTINNSPNITLEFGGVTLANSYDTDKFTDDILSMLGSKIAMKGMAWG
jgi:TP901 family phage tail tape measure protein